MAVIDRNLYAVSLIENGTERIYILSSRTAPKSSNDWSGSGSSFILEVTNPALKDALKKAGVNTKTALEITSFNLKEADNTEREVMLGIDSVVESEDKQFQNQYAVCRFCNHPISSTVETVLNQRQIDSYNIGETIKVSKGTIYYNKCRTCGRSATVPIGNMSVYKSIGASNL